VKAAILGLVAVPTVVLVGAVGLMSSVTPAATAPTCIAGPVPAADGTPSILGAESLTTLDIAAWWARTIPGPDPSSTIGVDVETLAQDYLSAGSDNGVRGDLAFAQAVIETGAFTSSDARDRFNFAGIAHPTERSPARRSSQQPRASRHTCSCSARRLAPRSATSSPMWRRRGPVLGWPRSASSPAPGRQRPTTGRPSIGSGRRCSTARPSHPGRRYRRAVLSGRSASALSVPGLTNWPTVLAFLEAQLGKPYLWGATGPDSYDCSGLVEAAFATIGVRLPRTSEEQYAATIGTAFMPSSADAIPPGSLLFGEGIPPGHVRVSIGGGLAIAAPYTGQVVRVEQIGPLSELTAVTLPVPS